MGEFIGPLQEQLVLPERWAGHMLGDDCMPEKGKVNDKSDDIVDFREKLKQRQLKRLDEEAREALRRVLDASAHMAIPQFKKGENFDMTRLSIGQALRFEKDKIQADKDGKPTFSRGISWGVVSELDDKRFAIEFDGVQSSNGIHFLGWSVMSEFPPIVGEPVHLEPRQDIQGRDLPETIERVNWIHAISPTEPLFRPRSFVRPPERSFGIIYQR